MQRTTLLLDSESHKAAREIAQQLECSVSEAVRRAVVAYRVQLAGASAAERVRRQKLLARAFEAFADVDPAAEARRSKREDEGF